MRRCLLLALLFLLVPLAGCVTEEPGAAVAPQAPVEEPERLAILDTPRSTFTELLCDDDGCLRQLTAAASGPANEVMVAMDATDPSFLLAGAKDYGGVVPDCPVVSVYASTDGGRTWTDGYPRPTLIDPVPDSTTRCESDPVAAFDGLGNGIMITLYSGTETAFSLNPVPGLFTYRTGDHGQTWEEVGMAFKGVNDKNWAATDYARNRIYSITRFASPCGSESETVTVSDDSGMTWDGPYCIEGMDFGQIAVGPDGTVYAAGLGGPPENSTDPLTAFDETLVFSRSRDGGMTWSPVRTIATTTSTPQQYGLGQRAYRTPILVSMAVALETGAIYVTWHDRDPQDMDDDVFFSASFDGGGNWTDPQAIDPASGLAGAADQFLPAVAASPTGDAHVIWFDTRADPSPTGSLVDVYYAHSPDGRSFEPSIRLTPDSFIPYLSRHQLEPVNLGDYIGITASNEEAVAVFPVTYNARSEIHAAIIGGPLLDQDA